MDIDFAKATAMWRQADWMAKRAALHLAVQNGGKLSPAEISALEKLREDVDTFIPAWQAALEQSAAQRK